MTLLITLLTPIPTAQATSVIAPTIEEMAVEADAIVVGEVIAIGQFQSNQGIERAVTVHIQELWKNSPSHPITIHESITVYGRGGVTSDNAHRVIGSASFEEGEKVVLFLQRNQHDDGWQSYLLAWTKFRIRTDEFNVPKAVRDPAGLKAYRRAQQGNLVQVQSPTTSLTIEELKTRVDHMLHGISP